MLGKWSFPLHLPKAPSAAVVELGVEVRPIGVEVFFALVRARTRQGFLLATRAVDALESWRGCVFHGRQKVLAVVSQILGNVV